MRINDRTFGPVSPKDQILAVDLFEFPEGLLEDLKSGQGSESESHETPQESFRGMTRDILEKFSHPDKS